MIMMLNKLLKYTEKIWFCKVWDLHDWSTPVERGEPLLIKDPVINNLAMSLYKHCRMTCTRCGVEAEVSRRFYNRIIENTIANASIRNRNKKNQH